MSSTNFSQVANNCSPCIHSDWLVVAARMLRKDWEPSLQKIKNCHHLLAKGIKPGSHDGVSEGQSASGMHFMPVPFQLQPVSRNNGKVRARNIPVYQGVINVQVVVKAVGMVSPSVETLWVKRREGRSVKEE